MDFNKALFGFIKVAFSIMIALIVVIGGIKVCTVGYDFGYRVFTEPAVSKAPGRDVLVQVTDGMSAKELGQLLEDKGLVNDGTLFYIQLKLSAYAKKITPGVYTLNTSMTAKDMMVVMAENYGKKNSETESTQNTENASESGVSAADEEGTVQEDLAE